MVIMRLFFAEPTVEKKCRYTVRWNRNRLKIQIPAKTIILQDLFKVHLYDKIVEKRKYLNENFTKAKLSDCSR